MSSSAPRPRLRPDLVDLEPYSSPQRPARVRMNTNESPYPPPRRVVDAALDVLEKEALNRYPDHGAEVLHEVLAARLDRPADAIWIANGSNEVFLHLFLTYGGPGRKLLVFEPTYSMHTKIARMAGTEVVSAAREPDWSIGEQGLADALEAHEPDLCVFCSPNNPTGNLEARSAIEVALSTTPLVIVDEAYVEFSGTDGCRDLLAAHENLVIVRTFSKAWRLAGARLGYALGAPDILDGLKRVALPYGLSTLSQAIGAAVIAAEDEALVHVEAIRTERARLGAGMEELGLQPWPSDSNFILFPLGDRSRPDPALSAKVWQGLLDDEVLVRDYRSDPVLAGHLRVTAGEAAETDAFLAALRGVLDG